MSVTGLSFRLGGKVIQAGVCTCLYRAADPEAMSAQYILLTRDGRFACLDRVIGGKGPHAATEWSPARTMRFLVEHGEGDLVDEFPDIFRKRAQGGGKPKTELTPSASPKGRPAEPFLFPLV
jgi:hypothetical protein